jgi:DNA helicase-2/ATP-dependent DNA helicase PcrA
LEFPVVFLVGLEQGLFPNYRSMNDPAALEEERRLCYVGITRAKERLFLSHAQERRLYGTREPAVRSQFLDELPRELLATQYPRSVTYTNNGGRTDASYDNGFDNTNNDKPTANENWQVGDRVMHKSFGAGEITHIFGGGNKVSVAIKFPGLGQKIIDPKVAKLQKME